jgi:hypothetical protein
MSENPAESDLEIHKKMNLALLFVFFGSFVLFYQEKWWEFGPKETKVLS